MHSTPDSATSPPPAPRGLGQSGQRLWRAVVRDWDLPEAMLTTLRLACQALDQHDDATAVLASEGMTVSSGTSIKAHPAASVQRDSRLAYLRAMRELALEDALPDARPPRIAGRR